jgi:ABC-type multidrug transport system fused ATPase/permease subunit
VKFFLPYAGKMLVLVGFGLLSAVFFLVGPYLSKPYIDQSFLNKDLTVFIKITLIGIAIFLVSTASSLTEEVIKKRISIKVKLSLARKFIGKLYSLDYGFFQSKSTGESLYRISDIDMVAQFMLNDLPRLVVDFFSLLAILSIALFVDFRLTIMLVILSPAFILQSIYIRRKVVPIYNEIWKSNANLSKKVQEAFAKIQIIKAFRLEKFQDRYYIKLLIQNIRLGLKSFRWFIVSSLTSTFLAEAICGALSIYGGWLIIKGKLSLGSYTAVMLYIGQFATLLQSLSSHFEFVMQQSVSIDKFFEVMEMQPRIRDLPQAQKIASCRGGVFFAGATFGYEEAKPVVSNLNLKIPEGVWAGIAGPSGCGKTTLINLLLRMYELWDGRVTIGDRDIREIKLDSLRERVAIATQEPLLFDLSIRENIGYGLKHPGEEKITEAVRLVLADDFIRGLPQGYDTLLGENACHLSQGYKQRIALARAIVRDSDLLILDEATSSIDSATEEKILRSLRQRRQGRTTLIVSHRLSTIKDAEKIYFFLPDGKVEEGGHEELLEKSPAYREFFANQMG